MVNPLIPTPRLPVVDWTEPRRFKWTRPFCWKTKSGFCACAITYRTGCTHCTGAGWAPGPVWTGAENLAPSGIRSPDRPARSKSLYRPRYPAHCLNMTKCKNNVYTYREGSKEVKTKEGRRKERKKERNGSLSSKKWLVKMLSCHVLRSVISAKKICRCVK